LPVKAEYYVVKAVGANGIESEASNRVGAYVNKLVAGFNWVSLPLEVDKSVYGSNAKGLWEYLIISKGIGVEEISVLADKTGVYKTYDKVLYKGELASDTFTVGVGQCYLLKVTAPCELVWAGNVIASESGLFAINTGYTMVYVPLGYGVDKKAKDVYGEMGLLNSNGDELKEPIPGGKSYQTYDGNTALENTPLNYVIVPGQVLQVYHPAANSLSNWPK
jgi:hypothetical protein